MSLKYLSLAQGRRKLIGKGLTETITKTGRHEFRDATGRVRAAWDRATKSWRSHWHKMVPDSTISPKDYKLNDKGWVVPSNSTKAHIPSKGKK